MWFVHILVIFIFVSYYFNISRRVHFTFCSYFQEMSFSGLWVPHVRSGNWDFSKRNIHLLVTNPTFCYEKVDIDRNLIFRTSASDPSRQDSTEQLRAVANTNEFWSKSWDTIEKQWFLTENLDLENLRLCSLPVWQSDGPVLWCRSCLTGPTVYDNPGYTEQGFFRRLNSSYQ